MTAINRGGLTPRVFSIMLTLSCVRFGFAELPAFKPLALKAAANSTFEVLPLPLAGLLPACEAVPPGKCPLSGRAASLPKVINKL